MNGSRSLPERVGFRFGAPGQRVNAMAYADDVMLFAASEVGMRALLANAESALAECGLSPNSLKSWSLCLNPSGKQKLLKVDVGVSFSLAGVVIPAVGIADTFRYLGVEFSASGVREAVPKIGEDLEKIHRAPLKPQQKLVLVRDYLLPGTYHGLVLGRVGRADLSRFDVQVRAFVRRWLRLPHDVPNSYLHAPVALGGLAAPQTERLVRVWRRLRLERILSRWEDDEEEELGEGTLEASEEASTDVVRQAQARDLYSRVDGGDLAESAKCRASYGWKLEGADALSGREFVQYWQR